MKTKSTVPDRLADRKSGLQGLLHDPMLLGIMGTAALLTGLTVFMYLSWGSGQVLGETPWFIPVMHSFAGLAAFSVAFLALGRYPVLRDTASYWIGIGFAAIGIQSVFFILTWPGLLAGSQGIIADRPNTSGWIALTQLASLSIPLLFAVLSRWPGEKSRLGRRWLWTIAGWITVVTLICILLVVFETSLPRLIGSEGNLTPLILFFDWIFLFLFFIGAIISARQYRQTGDSLIGYVAYTQIALTFVVLMTLIGAERYDIWFYVNRVILVAGFLVLMFGLLTEYVRLYRSEYEGKRAQQELAKSLEVERTRLAAILESLPVGIWVADPEGQLIEKNRQADQIWAGEAPLSESIEKYQEYAAWDPESGKILLPEEYPVAKVLQTGQPVEPVELNIRRFDGTEGTILVSAAPIRDDEGMLQGVVGINLDITGQKQAEQALRESEARFRQLADAMPHLVWTANPDGTVDYYNNRYQEYHGIAPREGKSWDWAPALHPDDVGPTVEAWQKAVESGEMYQFEHRVQMNDGTYRWHLSRGIPVCGESGQVLKWYGTATDIHDQKQVEASLRLSGRRLRRLVDANIIGIMYRTIDGQILEANEAFLDITGYSRHELEQSAINALEITPEEYHQQDVEAMTTARNQGSCPPFEKEYLRKDGSRVPVLIGFAQLDPSEEALVAFFLDLSQLKIAEANLKEYARRLEQSNRELENFAYIASHDLQEPLRKIRSFGDRVRVRIGEQVDDETRDFLNRMQDASRRMEVMIEDLLELSRVNTKGRPFAIVDLKDIVENVVSDLEGKIRESGGSVIVEDLPEIKADPLQMHLLLQNLIGNALKFHKSGAVPQVRIFAENIKKTEGSNAGMIKLYVSDNGIGFDEAFVNRIFQPFERLVGRSQYEGSGIGLAICKKIVERHGGTINARSTPGKGSTFVITLPY